MFAIDDAVENGGSYFRFQTYPHPNRKRLVEVGEGFVGRLNPVFKNIELFFYTLPTIRLLANPVCNLK